MSEYSRAEMGQKLGPYLPNTLLCTEPVNYGAGDLLDEARRAMCNAAIIAVGLADNLFPEDLRSFAFIAESTERVIMNASVILSNQRRAA
jgi:hypothetical protein